MIAYYVKSNQLVYNNPKWVGPNIPSSGSASVNILIDGNAFKFPSGYYYDIDIVTHRATDTFSIRA